MSAEEEREHRLRQQARQVLQSLEAKPGLFFEILRLVEEEFLVAGPWVETDPETAWTRYTATGDMIGRVSLFPGGTAYCCESPYAANGILPVSGDILDPLSGRQCVDDLLTAEGWLLA